MGKCLIPQTEIVIGLAQSVVQGDPLQGVGLPAQALFEGGHMAGIDVGAPALHQVVTRCQIVRIARDGLIQQLPPLVDTALFDQQLPQAGDCVAGFRVTCDGAAIGVLGLRGIGRLCTRGTQQGPRFGAVAIQRDHLLKDGLCFRQTLQFQ